MINTITNQTRTVQTGKRLLTSKEILLQLSEMIDSGILRAGDRLPPERDFARSFGISRTTLRAGIRSLAAVGILQSRHGDGTFVVGINDLPLVAAEQLRTISTFYEYTVDEIIEARIALETAVGELAAVRAEKSEIIIMSEEINRMNSCLKDPKQFAVHDNYFHIALANAAGNSILAVMINMIMTVFNEKHSPLIQNADYLKEAAEMNFQIFRAVSSRNAEKAHSSIEQYLIFAFDCFKNCNCDENL